MKVLFISSGFLGIYPLLEESIIKAFKSLNHSISTITPTFTNEIADWIELFQPDFALSFVGYKTDDRLLQALRKKGVSLGVWLTEDPYYIDRSIKLINKYNYIFTIDIGADEYYKEAFPAKNIHYLPLATDPSLYYPDNQFNYPLYDVCLVGYPYPNRIDLIHNILKQTSLTILLAGPDWKRYFPEENNKLKILNKWVGPDSVRSIYSFSKIVLNPHRPFHFFKNRNSLAIESRSINNRTFDIAACKGFQLIENKPDLSFHFDISQDIVPYDHYEECIHLINHFIEDKDLRTRYSQNARIRLLKSHTFFHRVKYIIEQVMGRFDK
ncbi:glycosyltransferase [bacterium LRH843]|nr:glycosyltransferase [bacterium LRH843]